MRITDLVQRRRGILFGVVACLLAVRADAEERPDPREILKTVRVAQAAQDRTVTGQLRTGSRKVPFRLTMKDNTIRWDFENPPQSLLLRLGENSSSLEEITPDGKSKVGGARFDDPVRDTDISFEDLGMGFLYWNNAEVEGEQIITLTRCWQLLVQPPSAGTSSYSKVRLWIAQETGALMKAEAFGRNGRLARTYRVVSGQKSSDGLWMLKQMRIESATPKPGGDRNPTYLEIDKMP
jgi:hypothetical protein